jgi:hypothetical protein
LVLRLVWVAGWLWAIHKQAIQFWAYLTCAAIKTKLEDNGKVPPLIIFYQQRLQKALFCVL